MLAHLTPKERMAYVVLFVLFLFAAAWIGAKQMRTREPLVIKESPPAASESKTQASVVLVDVTGAVAKPGVYRFHSDQRVQDAIEVAGGASSGADLKQINLAARLIDGTQVFIPAKGASNPPSAYAGGPTAPSPYRTTADASSSARGPKHPGSPVNLNSATAEQLQNIPGIGPSTAERILDYRSQHGGFRSIDELTAVGGIGQKKLEKMKKWLRL
jgi:competence protein ComEA